VTGEPPALIEHAIDAHRVYADRRRRDAVQRAAAGRGARSLLSHRGKYFRHRLAERAGGDIAFDATLRAAAARGGRAPLRITTADLRRKVRERRAPLVVALVLDNSYSVAAEAVLEHAKGVAFALLRDAAHRRDRVALVAFRGGGDRATVALAPTRSIRLVRERLEAVPLSGRTPLADALRCAHRLLRQARHRHPSAVPFAVLITDGRATVPLHPRGDAAVDALAQARRLAGAGVRCVVVDTAVPGSPEAKAGGATALARVAGAPHVTLADVAPEALAALVEAAA
jgi:magnesium chelatase subunit D